jgi:HPt (histidine-containing phosphotransfer) domain-containing protein
MDQSAPASETLAVLDLAFLARQTFDDRDLARELLILFDAQAEKLAATLAAPGAAAQKADLAHTLKGSARAVGAFFLGAQADAYEMALRDGDPQAERLLPSLLSAIEGARAALRPEI